MDYYAEVYEAQDPAPAGAHGWIQWKGTDVCMDVYCVCGAHGHIDGEFFYRYECFSCGRKFAVGQHVKMIELTPEQIAFDAARGGKFMLDEGRLAEKMSDDK